MAWKKEMERTFLAASLVGVLLAAPGALGQQDGNLAQRRTPVVEVFEASREAVVNITGTRFVEQIGFGDFDDLFQHLFDRPGLPRRRLRAQSVGSGFVLHESGYIVTNAHVVSHTADRKVVFGDGDEYDAEIIALDIDHDLAVLKITVDHPLKTLPFGTSSDLMVGETVIAIGNPFGFQHTVTAGVVSALGRDIVINDRQRFTGLIQTDASINPGNSGGPLLNVLGQLIGVNSAIRGDAENIGFAIPVDQLRDRLPELLSIERRYRVETGLSLAGGDGVVVEAVKPDSPAFRSGIRPGDAITAIEGHPTADLVDFQIGLLGHQPGDDVEIQLARGDLTIVTSLELHERPRADGFALTIERIGAHLQEIDREAMRELGLRGEAALLVTDVEPGSPAERIDMQRGDLLVEVNGQMPRTLGEIGEIWEKVETGDVVRLGFMRVNGFSMRQWTTNVRAE